MTFTETDEATGSEPKMEPIHWMKSSLEEEFYNEPNLISSANLMKIT